MIQSTETVSQLTRPIIGIENRTPLEVFDIMCDRIETARVSTNKDETIAKLSDGFIIADEIACAAIKDGFYVGEGLLAKLADARDVLTSTEKEG